MRIILFSISVLLFGPLSSAVSGVLSVPGYVCLNQDLSCKTKLADIPETTNLVTSIRSTGSTSGTGTPTIAGSTSGTGVTANANSSSSTSLLPTSTSPPSSDSSGLSTGAIAGISVGVAVPIILIAAAFFFCYRRRRRVKPELSNLQNRDNEASELPAKANTHELHPGEEKRDSLGKPDVESHIIYFQRESPGYDIEPNAHEMQAVNAYELYGDENSSKVEAVANITEISGSPRPATLYPNTGQHALPANAPMNPPVQGTEPSHIAVSPVPNTSGSDIEASGGQGPTRLDILRGRIDKVRAEKERLTKMQELDGLEAELQREIMEEQRRESEMH